MRTLDEVLALNAMQPTVLLGPPPSAQMRNPMMLPPMPYHPIFTALGGMQSPFGIPPIVAPMPPMYRPLPPPPPPPPPVMVPIPPRLPPLPVIMQPSMPPMVQQTPTGPSVAQQISAVAGAINNAVDSFQVGGFLQNFVAPPPIFSIGGSIGFSNIPGGGPGGSKELRFAQQLQNMSTEQIIDVMDRMYMSRAANIGGMVGSIAGGLFGSKLGPLGSLILGTVGEKIGQGIVDNPLTRLIFSPFAEHTAAIIRGAGIMTLGTQGALALATPGAAPTGLSFTAGYDISQRFMHQAQAWRWRTGASGDEARRYLEELSNLFSSAAQSGVFRTATNVDEVINQFNKVLRFSGKLARLMGDPDVKRNIEHLGNLMSLGMSLDQAMATTERVARFARPLGMGTRELMETGGAMGAQIWAQAGLAGGVGIAHGAFAQLLGNRIFASLSPMSAMMFGGQQQLAQAFAAMSAQFAAGLPGSLLTMTGLTGTGGLLGINPAALAGAQRGTFGQTAALGMQGMATAAQQLVRSGGAENIAAAYAQILMQRNELVSQAMEDPVQLTTMMLRSIQQLRRQGLPTNIAMAMIARDPQMARALQQAIADPNFERRLMNIDADRARREAEGQLEELRTQAAGYQRYAEVYGGGVVGIAPWFRRSILRPIVEWWQRRTERGTQAELLARGILVPDIEVTQADVERIRGFGAVVPGAVSMDPYERARQILQMPRMRQAVTEQIARPGFFTELFGTDIETVRAFAGQNVSLLETMGGPFNPAATMLRQKAAEIFLSTSDQTLIVGRMIRDTLNATPADLGEASRRLRERGIDPWKVRAFNERLRGLQKKGANINISQEIEKYFGKLDEGQTRDVISFAINLQRSRGGEATVWQNLNQQTAAQVQEIITKDESFMQDLMENTQDQVSLYWRYVAEAEARFGLSESSVEALGKAAEVFAHAKDVQEYIERAGFGTEMSEKERAAHLGLLGLREEELEAALSDPERLRKRFELAKERIAYHEQTLQLKPGESRFTLAKPRAQVGFFERDVKKQREFSSEMIASLAAASRTVLQMSTLKAKGTVGKIEESQRDIQSLMETIKELRGVSRGTGVPKTKDPNELLYAAANKLYQAAEKLSETAA